MKFIVDAQLPKSLADLLCDEGYDAIHTLDLPNQNNSSDIQIVDLSLKEDRVVITKDSDFLESFLVKAEPKKLILVKTGNIRNKELIAIFRKNLPVLVKMISRSDLLEISQSEIAEHGH